MNWTGFVGATTAAVLLAACGGGEAATPTDAQPAAAAAGADLDLAAFCDGYAIALQGGVTGDADGEIAGLDAMLAAGPEEPLAADLERFRGLIESEGQEAAHEATGEETLAAVHQVARNCAGEALEIRAVDYGYEGLPTELEAGRHVVTLINTSEVEPHEAIIVRKNDGVTAGPDELFQLPEEEVFAMITPVGYLHAVDVPETWVIDLEPGDYIVSCFLPVGGAEDGLPHAAEGMIAEFTVTA